MIVTTTPPAPSVLRPASTPTAELGPAHPRAILAIILVSYFLILLDNSIIFTGLPSIGSALHLDATGLSWVQDAYTLVFGGLLLLGARLGDLLGRRRVFVAGQGLAFAPLTTFGIAGVRGEDAGAASGLVNTAHQLGMALGLAALVAAAANATPLVNQVSVAIAWSTGFLALCLVVVLAVIVPGHQESAHVCPCQRQPAAGQ
jgi:MFS family permease